MRAPRVGPSARRGVQALTFGLVLSLTIAMAQLALDHARTAPYDWSALPAMQQKILAPLRPVWRSLDESRRLKWLNIARRYEQIDSIGRQRLQRRMLIWALLSPEQRRAARIRYQMVVDLALGQRRAIVDRWHAHQRNLESQGHGSTARR